MWTVLVLIGTLAASSAAPSYGQQRQQRGSGGKGGAIIDPENFLGSRGKRGDHLDDLMNSDWFMAKPNFLVYPVAEEERFAGDSLDASYPKRNAEEQLRPMFFNMPHIAEEEMEEGGEGFEMEKRQQRVLRPLGSMHFGGKRGVGKVLRPNGLLLVGKRARFGPNSSIIMAKGKRGTRFNRPNSSLFLANGKRGILRPSGQILMALPKRALPKPNGSLMMVGKRALPKPNGSLMMVGKRGDEEVAEDALEEENYLIEEGADKRNVEFFPVRGRRDAPEEE